MPYGYKFNFAPQTVVAGGVVSFDGAGPLVGVGDPGPKGIQIITPGDYLVEYSVVVEGAQAAAYALTLNDVEVPAFKSRYGAESVADVNQILSGTAVITAAAGDILRLKNIGRTADSLFGEDDLRGVLNASLFVEQLN